MKRPKHIGCVKLDPPKTVEQCAIIAMSEFMYWRDQEDKDVSIGAVAAAANIYAAISCGCYAPWHPKPKKGKK